MLLGRVLPGVAALDGLIYVCGGEEECQILANGECYDPQEDSWTAVNIRYEIIVQLNQTRSFPNHQPNFTIVIQNRDMFKFTVFGFVMAWFYTVIRFGVRVLLCSYPRTFHHYHILLHPSLYLLLFSLQIASMVVPRCEFGLCALDGYLYAMGGWVGEDLGQSIEKYDPALNEWSLDSSLPEPLISMGVVSYEGLIYIVGGCTHLKRHLQVRDLYIFHIELDVDNKH